ncbi:kinase-like domain-containing protein [Hypoxylon fragiforme]|uniref:kinase-like domain-containing protein n=1 Tax=Hypoxylon fragiforme TaxID=63214 RepID=UPI0020C6B789|nr:kinase-like domain-containing protein [Hypoxylon fragiforme]KAI2611096.1 kinase-like domain-containing protein [Hypoxylon fragiforme]
MSTVTMWWDSSRIETTVTRQFVCSHLFPEEIKRLDLPLGFGDGLTDGTYWEWIDEKAKRIFLILLDIGVPDQIFGLIDDSWDDDDLPIPLEQVDRLALTLTRDDKFDKKFYSRQYHYLLKFVEKGDHVVYDDPEVVPINVDKRPGLSLNNAVDRVELPNRPGQVFSRRRIPTGTGPGLLTEDELVFEINKARSIENDHIMSYFASYIHQGSVYVLFTLPNDFSLKSLLIAMPGPLKSLAKQDRRRLLMNWIHCLVDTLCYLHNRGLSHGNIKPSTILFNSDNHIFYTDISRLNTEVMAYAMDRSTFDKESYDYAAPEQWYRPSSTNHSNVHRRSTLLASSASISSSEHSAFSINRAGSDGGYSASMPHAPTPSLNPQAADIFSLGCVILELLSLQMKRQTRSFASHRGAKHKQAGRGGAVLDSSFHKNLGQVESWMAGLVKEASKKDDQVFRGVAPMLHVVARMLSAVPHERPTALEVERCTYRILTENCQILEPHCVHQYGGWGFGIGNLHINEEDENFHIAPKRHSGPVRPSSSRIGAYRPLSSSSIQERETAGSSSSQAMQNSQMNKVRTWQAHLYTGNGYNLPNTFSE